jgi:hypothetical protein
MKPKPISGSVTIKCKTDKCSSQFAEDFVFDLANWQEQFTDQDLTCGTCKKTYIYSRTDLILTPAKIVKEPAADEPL